ncbi:MAG: B12-binding domain-containing radical SAM protein [Candidatus Nezhaarchaeota archaeon]|nr:B12-binding domain-containing radical SAM protein [Candidatus Nezhaarchaeota archaeon]
MSCSERVEFLEYNVVKKSWRKSRLKIALCYPNTYKVGMTGLTVQQLYYLLNLDDEVLCERCFFSEPPTTIESQAELKAFDVIAFTLQYEEDYINMVKMLMNANINPLAQKRSENDPLIIAGGQAISANPLPLSRIVDCAFIGELEPKLYELIDALKEQRSKRARLNRLYDLDCVYFPDKATVKRSTAKDLDSTPHITAQLATDNGDAAIDPIFTKAFYIEACRSCHRKCRFCLVSWTNGPFRYRSFSKAKELLDVGLQHSKVKRVVLLGAAIFDVPWLKDMCKEVIARGLKISIPSLRPDVIDDELIKLIKEGGQRSLALGLESFSYKDRLFLGKPYEDSVIEETFQIVINEGLTEIKLYLITCLPREEGLDESLITLQKIIKLLDKGGTSLHISINPLIPKSNTPFQWLPPPDPLMVKDCYKKFIKLFRHPKVRIDFLNPYRASLQGILSLGLEDIGLRLVELAQLTSTTWFTMAKALSKTFRAIEEDGPWKVIDFGYDRRLLRRSFEEALSLINSSITMWRWCKNVQPSNHS